MATDVGYLDGLLLEIETADDRFEVAVAHYEYPFVDGADLENMGQKARTIRVKCHFWDEGDHLTYDDHLTLIEHLKKRDDFELIHPVYGAMKGKVESVDVHHDDSEGVVVDFAFTERFRGDVVAAAAEDDVDTAAESAFLGSQDEQLFELGGDLQAAGLDPSVELDPDLAITAQVTGITPAARAFVRQLDTALGWLDAQANLVTQPVNSVIATVTFATTVPGRILGTVERCVERVARLYDVLKNFPARFAAGVDFGLAKIEADLDTFLPDDRGGAKALILRHYRVAAARRLALETGYVYAADQGARRVQKTPAVAFDVLGRYIPRPVPDVAPMNAIELETTLAAARDRLQTSVDEARAIQGLKDLALVLLQSVSGLKQGAENVVQVTVDGTLPLHLVCLRNGLSYADAQRVMAINPGLRNPTFTSGKVGLYAK